MQLQVILILILAVSFCTSVRYTNRRKENSNKKRKNVEFITDDERNIREDATLSTTQLINKYGYPAEIHSTITEDGYILEVHRIPRPGAQPVLLVHGLLDASSSWVLIGPKQGFAYLLYDLGYDVWMANVRGNTYSRKHISLDPNKAEFWNFTFHEIGFYDIPAIVDYVLKITNFKKLQYIGHSQGSTSFFIMCSLRPEYNTKIISMQALAPAAFLGYVLSPIMNIMAIFRFEFFDFLKSNGLHEFLPSNDFLKSFASDRCRDGTVTQFFCLNALFLISGYDYEQINSTLLPVMLGHSPAGASAKQLMHYAQLIISGLFRQFDYGKKENLKKYGRPTPPDYDLKKVTAKVAIHYGENDILTTPQGIEQLRQALPNVVGKYLVDFRQFGHMDFMWGIDARKLVYYKVTKLMKSLQNEDAKVKYD